MSQANRIEIESMRDANIPDVFSLIDKEKWGWELNEIRKIFRLDSRSSVVALEDDRVVGLVTAINYGTFAFIVHVIVAQSLRGRGLGKRMMGAALERLDRAGVLNTELHAMPDYLDFYSQFGFESVEDVSFYTRDPSAATAGPDASMDCRNRFSWLPADDIETLAKLESEVLGYDLSECRRALSVDPPDFALASMSQGRPSGILMARMGVELNSIGVWTLENPDMHIAEMMLDAVSSALPPKPIHICVPTANKVSRQVLQERGFSLLKDDIVRVSRSAHDIEPFPASVLSVPDFEII
jgi:predicted N-acetyltransferase YhbS